MGLAGRFNVSDFVQPLRNKVITDCSNGRCWRGLQGRCEQAGSNAVLGNLPGCGGLGVGVRWGRQRGFASAAVGGVTTANRTPGGMKKIISQASSTCGPTLTTCPSFDPPQVFRASVEPVPDVLWHPFRQS
jgi:hypothetical protein